MLPVEGGRAEVDELDPGVAHAPDVALGGGAVLAVPVRAHEQDVLRLQVGVGQVVVVQKLKIKYLELSTSLISTCLRPLLSIYRVIKKIGPNLTNIYYTSIFHNIIID